ncbi:MAG: hypothetical protein ACTSRA_09540 [Promethearchaeota archaeon]
MNIPSANIPIHVTIEDLLKTQTKIDGIEIQTGKDYHESNYNTDT